MPRSQTSAAFLGWLALLLLPPALLTLAGCQGEEEAITSENSGYEVAGAAGDESEQADGTRVPPSTRSRQVGSGSDSYRVTELDDEPPRVVIDPEILEIPEDDSEILAYYERLSTYQPEITSEQEANDARTQLLPVLAEASARVMALEGVTPDQRRQAMSVRLMALSTMSSLNMPGADDKINDFIQELSVSGIPFEKLMGEMGKLETQVSTDPAPALETLRGIVAENELTRDLFLEVSTTGLILQRLGFTEAAMEANGIIGEAFRDHADPGVAGQARMLLADLAVTKLLENGDAASADQVVQTANALLEGEVLTDADFNNALQAASMLEFTSYLSRAQQLYTAMQQELDVHREADGLDSEGDMLQEVDSSIARVAASLEDLGQPIELEGVTLAAEPFDWSAYQGQVVLIDFWATWCQPCIAEMPNLVDLHEKYHDQGFEVVGINLDEDTEVVREFLARYEERMEEPFPWQNIVAASPEQAGLSANPNALRYGVKMLPYTMLVDRQGNIALIHARGKLLEQEIQRLLAEPASPAETGALHPPRNRERVYFTAFQDDTAEGSTPTEEAPAEDTPAVAQPDRSLLPPELQTIPEDRAELLVFLEKLVALQEDGQNQAHPPDYWRQLMPLQAETAARVLAGEATAEQRAQAVELRIDALRLLALLSEQGAHEELVAFVGELTASDDPQVAARGRLAEYQLQLDALLKGEAEDAAPVLAQLETILAEAELDRDLFAIVLPTSQYLAGGGFEEEAKQAELMVAEAFQQHDDPEVAATAQSVLAQSKLAALIEQGDRAAADAVLAYLEQLAAQDTLDDNSLLILLQASQALEFTGYLAEAQQVYRDTLAAAHAQHEQEPLEDLEEIEGMLNSAIERLDASMAAVGQPVELSGELANGAEFNWSDYQGQVVFVDFWASWDQTSIMDFGTLVDLQERFQDDGFTVLGVNLDPDPARLRTLLENAGLPWQNLVPANAEVAGMENDPNALRYHVDTLPYTMLVDRQGNIVSINPRGEQLASEIERLLAEPVPVAAATEQPAEEPAEVETPAPEDSNSTPPADTGSTAGAPEQPVPRAPEVDLTPGQVTQAPPLVRPGEEARTYNLLPPDLQVIPTGSTEERLEFLDTVKRFQDVVSRQGSQAMGIMQDLLPLRLELTTKLMEEELPEDRRLEVLDYHIETLRYLRLFDFEDTRPQLTALAEQLAASEDPAEAKRAAWIDYLLTSDALASGGEVDPASVLAKLTALLDNQEPTLELYGVVQATPRFLQNGNYEEEASQATQLIGETFLASSDPAVIHPVTYMVINHEFPRMLEPGDPASARTVLSAAKALLDLPELDSNDLQNLVRVVGALEYAGSTEAAFQLSQEIETTLAELPEPEGQDIIFRQMLAGHLEETKARLTASRELLGQPLTLAGEYLGGDDFNWDDYRGKVVLVNYWASDNETSLEEIPDVNELYHDYREENFTVVGVNLDEDRQAAQRYDARHPTRWRSVVSPETAGPEDPNAARYQVQLPCAILVDQEGNVVLVQARGGPLKHKLAELLDLPSEPATAPGEAPAAEDGAHLRPAEGRWYVALQDDTEGETETMPLEEAPPAAEETGAEDGAGIDAFDNSVNPYAPPPGLSKLELMEYILDMTARPVSIQNRPGFNAGLVAACEELLAQEPSERAFLLATKTQLDYLHRDAARGDEDAQARVIELAEALAAEMPENADDDLRGQVAFYLIEGRALEVDGMSEQDLINLLADIELYMTDRELGEPHLRLASQTVRAINHLPEDRREDYFQTFGGMWAESESRQLARYGRRIGDTPSEPAQPQQVGKMLAGAGVGFDGVVLDLEDYRGQVLIVDFWATWCGPCIAELPNVEATYRELHEQGLEIVGISLDREMEDLAAFLAEHPLPWPTMAGEECTEIATQYGVRAIPTMMLVDREGKIVAVAHSIDPLKEQAIALLAAPVEEGPAEEEAETESTDEPVEEPAMN